MAAPNPKRSGDPTKRTGAAGQRASAARETVSARSRNLLVRLSRLPPLVIPAVMLVLMLAGLMAPFYLALPALLVVAVFVLWLAYLSWPVLDTRARALRGFMLGAVAVALLGRISGWL